MDKFKIGIICSPYYSGAGVLGTELGKRLAKLGHKVHFITSEAPFRLIEPWRKNIYFHRVIDIDYPTFSQFNLFPLLLANKIAEIAKLEKLDVIHAHYALPFASAVVLAKQILKNNYDINIKAITTLHGTDISLFSNDYRIHDVLKYALEKNDVVTAVCKWQAKLAQENLELSKQPRVIYNFVDVQREPEDKIKELRAIFVSQNEKIIMHASNFRNIKRIQDVITIFHNVNKKIPSKLLLAGDGPELRTAQKFATKFGLIPRIHFMGVQTNVSRLLSISDLFLLPSELEAFSLAALEAMFCKVPVMASRTGGMPEMIDNGKTSFLADIGDIKTMSDSIIKLFKDPELYQKIAENAHEKVVKNFSPERIVGQYEKLYREVLNRP